jgi:hypothetical protein
MNLTDNDPKIRSRPRSPTNGQSLAVFGSVAGVEASATAAGAGTGLVLQRLQELAHRQAEVVAAEAWFRLLSVVEIRRSQVFQQFWLRSPPFLFQTKGIDHFPVHVEFLPLGNFERLVGAIVQSGNNGERWINVPHLSGYLLGRGDRLRRGGDSDGPLKSHARFQVVNAKLPAIYCHSGTFRHIGNVSDGAIFHFDDQVIAIDEHHFPAFYGYIFTGRPGRCALLRLNLSDRGPCRNITNYPTATAILILMRVHDFIGNSPN